MAIAFTSLLIMWVCHHLIPSQEEGEYSIERYFERERDHIRITFIIVYYYNSSILLFVIIVNLLLCLSYTFNFLIGMYV